MNRSARHGIVLLIARRTRTASLFGRPRGDLWPLDRQLGRRDPAYPVEGGVKITSAEVHFAWALDGKAVQDVWITPSRRDRAAGVHATPEMYGTTVRVFDPKRESWPVVWLDPVSGRRIELEGRRQGDDIVQVGTADGWPIRWTISAVR